jgi:pimeloyl-ACP methyl ester carboxylesterase
VSERTATVGEIEIVYEEFGDESDPVMLLIMGLGIQMLGWDEELCRMLAARGFRVVRFDNRDVGRSSRIEGGPRPDWMALAAGDPSSASYTLSEMADDAVGLLDHLGAETAHLVGASQGGMIAQVVAIREPARVLSLTSIMSTTGDREVGQPRPEGLAALFSPPAPNPEAMADWAVANWRTIGSPGFPLDEEAIRARTLASFERGYSPEGVARQLAAVLASPDRTSELGELRMPTLVIHGADDVLIDVSGGKATARAVPDAELIVVPGMGHDLPRALWPRFVDAIVANAERGQARAAGAAAAPESRTT